MKTLVTLTFCLAAIGAWASGPENSLPEEDPAFISYDVSKNTWEQPNPVFRWPLPEMTGEAHLNVRFVWLGRNINTHVLEETKKYLAEVYQPHGIYLNFQSEQSRPDLLDRSAVSSWSKILPIVKEELTIYILPFEGSELQRRDIYTTNSIVARRSLVPFQEEGEFKAFVAKNIGHMLGLLPTYFESSSHGVYLEDKNNCGNAGDFVCDTPADYLGLRNDVKKRNCRYNGEIGSPDIHNVMSNSWTECMDRISPEQANKIKYNISVIPALQATLNPNTTIPLNVDQQPLISSQKILTQ